MFKSALLLLCDFNTVKGREETEIYIRTGISYAFPLIREKYVLIDTYRLLCELFQTIYFHSVFFQMALL